MVQTHRAVVWIKFEEATHRSVGTWQVISSGETGAVVTGTSDLCSKEDPCHSSGKKPLPPTAPVLGLLSAHSEIGKMTDYMLQIFCHNKKNFFLSKQTGQWPNLCSGP